MIKRIGRAMALGGVLVCVIGCAVLIIGFCLLTSQDVFQGMASWQRALQYGVPLTLGGLLAAFCGYFVSEELLP
jgi:cell division protein FtsX